MVFLVDEIDPGTGDGSTGRIDQPARETGHVQCGLVAGEAVKGVPPAGCIANFKCEWGLCGIGPEFNEKLPPANLGSETGLEEVESGGGRREGKLPLLVTGSAAQRTAGYDIEERDGKAGLRPAGAAAGEADDAAWKASDGGQRVGPS